MSDCIYCNIVVGGYGLSAEEEAEIHRLEMDTVIGGEEGSVIVFGGTASTVDPEVAEAFRGFEPGRGTVVGSSEFSLSAFEDAPSAEESFLAPPGSFDLDKFAEPLSEEMVEFDLLEMAEPETNLETNPETSPGENLGSSPETNPEVKFELSEFYEDK